MICQQQHWTFNCNTNVSNWWYKFLWKAASQNC